MQVPGQRHQDCDVGAAQLHLGDRAELSHELRRMIDQLDDVVVPSAPQVGAATARGRWMRAFPGSRRTRASGPRPRGRSAGRGTPPPGGRVDHRSIGACGQREPVPPRGRVRRRRPADLTCPRGCYPPRRPRAGGWPREALPGPPSGPGRCAPSQAPAQEGILVDHHDSIVTRLAVDGRDVARLRKISAGAKAVTGCSTTVGRTSVSWYSASGERACTIRPTIAPACVRSSRLPSKSRARARDSLSCCG